jgi:hypothetical protein
VVGEVVGVEEEVEEEAVGEGSEER